MQDMTRLLFLAPQWVEGIAKKDAAIPYKLGMAAKDGGIGGVTNIMKGNDTIARGITRGMVSMFVLVAGHQHDYPSSADVLRRATSSMPTSVAERSSTRCPCSTRCCMSSSTTTKPSRPHGRPSGRLERTSWGSLAVPH